MDCHVVWARPRSLPQGVLVIYFGSAASWRGTAVVVVVVAVVAVVVGVVLVVVAVVVVVVVAVVK